MSTDHGPPMTRHPMLSRPIPSRAAALGALLMFGVVAGLASAAAQVAGLPRQWAFAFGWLAGFAVVTGRHLRSATKLSRRERWRSFGFQLGLMIVLTLLVTVISGARVFPPAT
jgi:hypothetical protein